MIESGKLSMSQEAMSLSEVLQDCQAMIEPEANNRGIAMRFLELDLPFYVFADRTRVKQVIVNLLSNAIKYNRTGGNVVVQCVAIGENRVRVNVKDSGLGLTPDQLVQLFQPFNRLGKEDTPQEGTGIGLVVTKQLVELMGGTIGVESDEGRGSTFWFTIDAPSDSGGQTLPDEENGPTIAIDLAPAHILLVDDVAVNRELVRAMLTPFGHTFEEAANGAEAVQSAMQAPFDLILMDLQMPGMDGIAAARAIRAAADVNRHTPIVALSANVLPEHLDACWEAGMSDHVAKPIVPAALLTKVAQWTSSRPSVDEEKALISA